MPSDDSDTSDVYKQTFSAVLHLLVKHDVVRSQREIYTVENFINFILSQRYRVTRTSETQNKSVRLSDTQSE